MKLLFKQRMFSWFDSYDIYDESGAVLYTVKGQLSWGHCLKIFDAQDNEIATVKERIFSWYPRFEMYLGAYYIGCIQKEFSFFKPRYNIDCNGWQVEGDFWEWNYSIVGTEGQHIAKVSKEWAWTDTYSIDVCFAEDALCALMLVLAIDAEKCSRN